MLKRAKSFIWLMRGLFLTAALLCTNDLQARVLRVNQTEHPLDAYAVGALRIALKYMPGNYQLEVANRDITQTRAIQDLETDNMDVMWLATNTEVEEQLLPIRFPLLKGLLGHRVFIINPNAQSRFAQVRTFEDIKALSFGQGQGWPDVEILRSNGLKVITTSKYNNLFYMVEGGRFDGFPRGVLEPWVELAAHPELGLTVDKYVVLVYKLPFYLFVRKDAVSLANAIKDGLDAALESGEFDEYFYNTKQIQDAINRSNLGERVAFELKNPSLHRKTPLDKPEYWLNLKEL